MHPRTRLLLIALAAGLALVSSAVAHAKMLEYIEPVDDDWGGLDDPYVVEQGKYSAGFYGRLQSQDGEADLDAFSLVIDEPVAPFALEMLVPQCGEHFAGFYPAFAVIGPGLAVPDDDTREALPFDVPEEMGIALFVDETRPDDEEARVAEEGLSALVYYTDTKNAVLEDGLAEGEYLLVVWEPDEREGAYTLLTGALHPEGDVWPAAAVLRDNERLLRSRQWMGWDCASDGAAAS